MLNPPNPYNLERGRSVTIQGKMLEHVQKYYCFHKGN